MPEKDKTPTPMDPSIIEDRVGSAHVNTGRACYAAKTLVAEVEALFPGVPVDYSNRDGRSTALDVSFDLTVLDEPDGQDLVTLLTLLGDSAHNEDPRIREVMADPGTLQVLVGFRSNPRTQDSREPFGLADALDVLSGDESEGDVL
jgi:hypothetical protein